MSRPQKSTTDRMIDEFDRFDVEAQERVLDHLQLVHRLAKRREKEPRTEQLELKEAANG